MLKVDVDFVYFCLKFSDLLLGSLFGRLEDSRGGHDSGRFVETFFALDRGLLFNQLKKPGVVC